ncbi:peptidoglycan hydrolase [Bacillus methanolicus]|uniref:glycosyl hydrolase family 18 protein n=1 Tax=Bacillus methanolicus TaxID=1471 RepID=UPI00200E1F97|nr:glycosyl hydrolase family 18 protein [Bacillus methanolicus]UQD51980.1 peptidoglycan hydrolase [Bacillus methanolicus]
MARVEFDKQKVVPKKWILAGLLLSFFLIFSSILIFFYPFASPFKKEYFTGKNPIIFEGKQEGNALIEKNSIYIPLSLLKKIDDSITYDEKSNSVIITTADKVVQMPSESLTYFINQKPVKLNMSPIKTNKGELYLSLDTILPYFPLQYRILNESGAIWIQKDGETIKKGTITNDDVQTANLRLRTEPKLLSPYTAETKSNETVFIEHEKKEFYFVRKMTGEAGYIRKDFVKKKETITIKVKREQKKAVLPKINGPVQLTWEAVYKKNPDTKRIPPMPGVNVVSPTWFELASETGSVKNLGSLDYVKWAKKRKYQVWGLFSNAFNPYLTKAAFKDFETRQTIIRQLLHYSKMYHLDGINLDIENVNEEDGPFVTQFVREAVPYFHEAGLIVSMDITFISTGNWSAFYERDKLAELVDYLIVMAYDEHWANSPVAGSVASLPWVENNLKKLLEEVPNEKLILGVPLFTRLWKEQHLENGTTKLTSKALSMDKVKEWLKANKVKPKYDPTTGQNYAEYYSEKEKATYKIWLEDELSLKKRSELAKKYKLAGVASWSRYYADDKAWAALNIHKQSNVVKK